MNTMKLTSMAFACSVVATLAFASPAFCEDAYIENANGNQYFNTGHFIGPHTRIEIDFQLLEIKGQIRPFGVDGADNATRPYCELYLGQAVTDGPWVWSYLASKSDYYSKDDIRKVYELIDSIPARNTFIHGDFHPGNIMVQNDELILIDMGDASVGHPVIDLLGTYQLMSLTPKKNPGVAMRYLGMTTEEAIEMWDLFIRDYLGTDDDKTISDLEKSLISFALIRNLGGIVFSDVISDEKRRYFSDLIMKDLLDSIEKADMIIKAV